MTRNIAIYGKGGIGKSTTASNISAALSDEGYRVMQIGCDPKSDFTKTLRGGEFIPTVLDTLRSGKRVEIDGIVHQGYSDILCIEAGGPEPGVGCAGRGIITDPGKSLGKTTPAVDISYFFYVCPYFLFLPFKVVLPFR